MNMTKADVDRAFGRLKKQVAADKRKIPRLSDREIQLCLIALFWRIDSNEECINRGCGTHQSILEFVNDLCDGFSFKVTVADRKKIASMYVEVH